MADSFLVEDTEYSNAQDEEDPILVAQRYLNIFHQIHIFNAAKKEEFDKSLIEMDDKTKELLATIPGGRVLLEHVKEIEEKQGINSGETSELIAQNIEEEKKSLKNIKQTSNVAAVGGELTLGSDFAESLATSLAAALKSNNVASSGGNMEDLAQLLNKSFNAYATSMQTLTRSLVSQNSNTVMQQTQSRQQPLSSNANIPPQSMAAQQNNTSTTVNNINMDTSYFNNINQTLMQNDARRHQDMMQIVEALNKNIQPAAPIGGGIVSAAVTEAQTLAIADSVTEALKQNSSQQMEAIKAFGEMLVQAFTQSQQELAQTLAQSAPRHTVKVVVSQDVDVEDQTGVTTSVNAKPAVISAPTPPSAPQSKKNEQTPKKEQNQKNDKANFIKNFSDKISETTNKITQNISNEAKNTSDTLLNRINKSLNKINDLKTQNQNQNKNNNQQPAKKTDEKIIKNENNIEKKENSAKNPQTKDNKQAQNPNQNINKNNIQSAPVFVQPQNKEQPKPAQTKPQPNKMQPAQNIHNETPKQPESLKQTPEQPSVKSQPKKEDLSLADILAEIPTETTPNKSSAPDIFSDNSFGTPNKSSAPDIFSDNSFGTPNKSSAPDIFSDNSFGTPNKSSAPDIFSDNSFGTPVSEQTNKPAISQPDKKAETPAAPASPTSSEPMKEYKKSQLHSYEDALLKIKNALSSDDDISINNMDVKPVSLGDTDDLSKPETQQSSAKPAQPIITQPQKTKNEELWSFDDNLKSSDDGDWEYVDENGNPVSADDGDWEYVDENGNPVSADDGDWEYVDENGNPVSADDGDWEYVDENGNPVSADDGDWEYVDENGNPIENKQ